MGAKFKHSTTVEVEMNGEQYEVGVRIIYEYTPGSPATYWDPGYGPQIDYADVHFVDCSPPNAFISSFVGSSDHFQELIYKKLEDELLSEGAEECRAGPDYD